MSADAVFQQFAHDALNLFLGSAFVTLGLIAIAFSILRKKPDALLIYFGIFAALWGFWFWLSSGILTLVWPKSLAYERLRDGIGYLLPLPTVLYFRSAGLMS